MLLIKSKHPNNTYPYRRWHGKIEPFDSEKAIRLIGNRLAQTAPGVQLRPSAFDDWLAVYIGITARVVRSGGIIITTQIQGMYF